MKKLLVIGTLVFCLCVSGCVGWAHLGITDDRHERDQHQQQQHQEQEHHDYHR